MVRHIVMWRLKDREGTLDDAAKMDSLRQCIAAMRTGVDGLVKIELGIDRSRTPDSADLVLYSEFTDWPALDRYQTHPLHEEFRQLLGPLRSERRLGDYEI